MTDNLVWQYKDNEPIEVQIDKFIETQIELCLLGIVDKWFRLLMFNESEER